MPCFTDPAEADHSLSEDTTKVVALTEADVKDLTERFLFGDPGGAKATGPTGAAACVDLGLIVVCEKVRNALWPSRRSEIKAVIKWC